MSVPVDGLPPIPEGMIHCPAWRNRRHKIVKCISPDERDCMSCPVGAKAVENDGRTHWQGCWRHHRECATAMIERIRSTCGHPDAAEACRLILETTKEEK